MNEKKVLLVTGASSDIGIKIIGEVYENYDTIWAHYNHESEALKHLKEKCGEKLELIQADFSSVDSVKSMITVITESGKFPDHIIHLSAPKFRIQKFVKESEDAFRKDYTVSVDSIISILRALVPHMVKNKNGKIIFALSSNTIGMPVKFQSSYTVSKYALLGLMKSLAVEYADKNITVNAVSPDMVNTKFLSEIPELIVQQAADNSPLKRNLDVEEVAPVFKFLLSDDGNRITGENISITGGSF